MSESEDAINNPQLDDFAQTFSTPQPAATAAAATAVNNPELDEFALNFSTPQPAATAAAVASAIDATDAGLRGVSLQEQDDSADIDAPSTTTTTGGVASRYVSMSPNTSAPLSLSSTANSPPPIDPSVSFTTSNSPPQLRSNNVPPIKPPLYHNILELLESNNLDDLFLAVLATDASTAAMGTSTDNATEAHRIKMKTHQESEECLNKLIKTTIGALRGHNKCYSTLGEKQQVNTLTNHFKDAIKYLHKHIDEICVQDNENNWEIAVFEMMDLIYKATGQYLLDDKVGCNVLKSKGIGKRVLEQLEDPTSSHSSTQIREELELAGNDEAEEAIVKQRAKAIRTTQDNLTFAKNHPAFQKIIADMMMASNSYHCYSDHIIQNFHEALDFTFEMFLGCSLVGCSPVFVMERFLCLGSERVRQYLRLPDNNDNRNSTVIQKVRGTHVVMQIQTWEPYLSRIRAVCRDGGVDPNTEEALVAMIRTQLRDGYLQWHTTVRFWGYFDKVQHVKPVDVLSDPIYPQVENVAKAIVNAIRSSDDDKENAINEALEPILNTRRKSNDTLYVEPDEEDLCRAGEYVIPRRIQDAINSPHQQVLIEIEKCMIKSSEFDPDIRNSILIGTKHIVYSYGTNEEAGELWETTHGQNEGKTILIFVICSNHVIYGWNKTMEQRLRNGSFAITYMAIKEGARLIPEGTTEREQKIMLSFFVGAEGLFGDINTPDGSFFGSVRNALPTGYFTNAFRLGTHALAYAVSPTLHPLHIVSLMVSMGFVDFVNFYELRTGKRIPEDSTFAEFLAENAREHEKELERAWRARERELFAQLRKIASIPDCMRSESQMATVDELVMSHGQHLVDAICKCDIIVTQYDEESNWGGVYQQLLGVVSERRLKQYIAYLGTYDDSTANTILSDGMVRDLPNECFDRNNDQDQEVQEWFG